MRIPPMMACCGIVALAALPLTAQNAPREAKSVVVPSNVAWTNTLIKVRHGEWLRFEASGEIRLSYDRDDTSLASGSRTNRLADKAPFPAILLGTLIGRVNSGKPFAIGNTMLFGVVVAALSRLIALIVGLLSGYKGGWIDRVLMSVNDTFIVIPLFPILVLFYFVLKDHMSWSLLALMMACLGWSYDARLIRSVALSLRHREFTETGIFSGMSMRQILVEEHLPYVLPIVFSTTMNNINWSIGLEVTLSVLGFTDINTPTIGVLIYWANQHTALVAGIWWWIFFPVLLVVTTFVGLFLLAVSMNEYIDPRSRLGRTER